MINPKYRFLEGRDFPDSPRGLQLNPHIFHDFAILKVNPSIHPVEETIIVS